MAKKPEKKTIKKTSKSKSPSISVMSWEPPKVNLTEEKASMLNELMKDKGIEYHMGCTLKNQVDAYMQGVNAGKKSKKKADK